MILTKLKNNKLLVIQTEEQQTIDTNQSEEQQTIDTNQSEEQQTIGNEVNQTEEQ